MSGGESEKGGERSREGIKKRKKRNVRRLKKRRGGIGTTEKRGK